MSIDDSELHKLRVHFSGGEENGGVDQEILRNERRQKKKGNKSNIGILDLKDEDSNKEEGVGGVNSHVREIKERDLEMLDMNVQTEQTIKDEPVQEKQLEVESKEEKYIDQIEDILLALNFVSARAVAENKGKPWFMAILDKKMKAVERTKQRGGKIAGFIRSDGNFSREDNEDLLNGIYYLGSLELRESRFEDWKDIKGYLESKYGLDTEKIIPELLNLYKEGKEAEVSLMRMVSDNKLEGLVEPLKLVKGYMESGRHPSGWGMAKKAFEEVGIKVGSYERMREIERKKKSLDEAIFGKRETAVKTEPASEKVVVQNLTPEKEIILPIEKINTEERRIQIQNELAKLTELEEGSERYQLLSSLENKGVKIRKFLDDMERALPGQSKDLMRRLRAVVEVWRMDEKKKLEFPTMTKNAEDFARVLGLQ